MCINNKILLFSALHLKKVYSCAIMIYVGKYIVRYILFSESF